MNIETNSIKTLTINEVSEMISLSERQVTDMIKEGVIIAIERGGYGMETYYKVPEIEVERFLESVQKLKEEKIQKIKRDEIIANGRKFITIYSKSLDIDDFNHNEIVISWVKDFEDFTFGDLFEFVQDYYKRDFSFMKKANIDVHGKAFKIYDKLSKMEYADMDIDGVDFLVAYINLEDVKEEKKSVDGGINVLVSKEDIKENQIDEFSKKNKFSKNVNFTDETVKISKKAAETLEKVLEMTCDIENELDFLGESENKAEDIYEINKIEEMEEELAYRTDFLYALSQLLETGDDEFISKVVNESLSEFIKTKPKLKLRKRSRKRKK